MELIVILSLLYVPLSILLIVVIYVLYKQNKKLIDTNIDLQLELDYLKYCVLSGRMYD